ncbi:MAG: hydroxyacid dehydrogenase [Alphaproteobacteria bacterium]|nr:hydroxyacid dehydrogenase [Alphaproteobacteria bacterium]
MHETTPSPYRVLIADDPHPVAAEILKAEGFDVAQIKKLTALDPAQAGDYDALLVRSGDVKDEAFFTSAKRLRVIARAGSGYDNINRKLAARHNIVVMNAPDGNAPAAAELTLAHILNLARQISAGNATMRAGTWSRAIHKNDFLLRGKILGIIGCGRIGSLVARYAKSLGMELVVYDPYIPDSRIEGLEGTRVCALGELLQAADIVTLHADLNNETRKMINAETLKWCKKGAYIVNCARGPMVDAAALAQAIEAGHVANAALDVIEKEPVKCGPDEWKANPLLGIDRVVFTPHVGGTTKESLKEVARQAAEQIVAYLRHGIIANPVFLPAEEALT